MAMGNRTVSEKLSGIDRAILFAGGQHALNLLLSAQTDFRITDRAVGKWQDNGYVSTRCVLAVSLITGVPVEDLVRPTPRKRRSDAKREPNNDQC